MKAALTALAVFFVSDLSIAANPASLTPAEEKEIQARLENFYGPSSGPVDPMDRRVPKWDTTSGRETEVNSALRSNVLPDTEPLLRQAMAKARPEYQRARCRKFLKQTHPWLSCDEPFTWETAAPNDQVEDLTDTWLPRESVSRNLDDLPTEGEVGTGYWSGDYWRMQWGLTSYRYSTRAHFFDYRKAIAAYSQPKDWEKLDPTGDPAGAARQIKEWSPAEKYDLLVGDAGFTLTNEQKNEGMENLGQNGNVESWFGLCHGWAPAALFVPAPVRTTTTVGTKGTTISWFPDDVRALATLAWANGNFRSNYIGGRCRAKNPAHFENGRLSDESCFDNNPATITAALGNMIGNNKLPFIMDASYDYEVWNQPIVAYQLRYFNPLAPRERSDSWKEVAVPYDDKFKAQDRFQKPLTRGLRSLNGKFDDSGISQIVGVAATVVFLAENPAVHQEEPLENNLLRVTYTYDLELHQRAGKVEAMGGEWHENTHPDFLWVPQRGSVAARSWDQARVEFDVSRPPTAEVGSLAGRASHSGYPLCGLLGKLVQATSGSEGYRCPTRD